VSVSRTWEQHIKDEERAHCPTDEDMLKELDAYGHLSYCVGYENDNGDWLACFDFRVFDHPERGRLVAYHTVVNSDSGGFIDTLESCVVEAAKAPFNLPDYWLGIGMSHGIESWTDEDIEEASKMNTSWNDALREALRNSSEVDKREVSDGESL
jgi:hypothetical protein